MPSIAFGETRSATSARIVPVAADAASTDAGTTIGRIGAALLMGKSEIRTCEPAVAIRARAVVDRLLAARAAL